MSKSYLRSVQCECGAPKYPGMLACSECNKDLEYRIKQMAHPQFYTEKELRQHFAKRGIGAIGICAICGGHYVFGGQNPNPVVKDEGARCCGACDDNFVIPARVKIENAR